MLRVENVKVYDLAESIIASGYAMGLNLEEFEGRSEAFEKYVFKDGDASWFRNFIAKYNDLNTSQVSEEFYHKEFKRLFEENGITDEEDIKELNAVIKDYKRILRLVNASKFGNVKCHHNFTTGIRVSFDLIYPNYISPEMQRYHWFDIVTSSSKMHRIMKMDFSKCCNEYVTEETKQNMQKYVQEYNDLLNTNPDDIEEHNEKVYKAFMKVISNCPQGVELFMRISTNYMQLQTMYFQRRFHRLKEDWGNFCDFIESLPLADELILGKDYLKL